MQTLYIDRKESELAVSAGRLTVRIPDAARPFSVPLTVLEFLVVSATVRFSSTLLTQLTLAGVTVVFLNPRKEEATSVAYGMLHNNADRRLLQYRAVTHTGWQLHYSRELMCAKIRGQQATLRLALRKRPDQRRVLTKGLAQLAAILPGLVSADNLDSLRGLEGAAAGSYFAAYQHLFPDTLQFNGRNRRPPKDPVNVVLSLSYTLLHAEATRVLISVGFDPQLGIYHLPSFGRESLACDLVEIYRPQVDRWVWRLFAEQILKPDHFKFPSASDGKPCILGKAGRSAFYSCYEIRARVLRKAMRRTARIWLERLQADQSAPLSEVFAHD